MCVIPSSVRGRGLASGAAFCGWSLWLAVPLAEGRWEVARSCPAKRALEWWWGTGGLQPRPRGRRGGEGWCTWGGGECCWEEVALILICSTGVPRDSTSKSSLRAQQVTEQEPNPDLLLSVAESQRCPSALHAVWVLCILRGLTPVLGCCKMRNERWHAAS